MNLGAFLLLLCGRAFLPSLKRLQEIDVFEGRLPNLLFPVIYESYMKQLPEACVELEPFLIQCTRDSKLESVPNGGKSIELCGGDTEEKQRVSSCPL